MNEESCSKNQFHYGGQAVMEGVMMRGAKHFAVAVRRLNGEIVSSQEPIKGVLLKLKWLNKPFLRGTLAIVDAMSLGIKTLMYSANIHIADAEAADSEKKAAQDQENGSKKAAAAPRKPSRVNDVIIGVTPVIAIAFALVVFKLIPAWFGMYVVKPYTQSQLWLGLSEGGFKLLMLLTYVSVISLLPDIRRVFQYHGAEHKTINAYEAGEELTVGNVQKYSTVHVRCGTSFLLVVIVASIIVYSQIPWQFTTVFWKNVFIRFGYQILLLPLVAGIAYEVIRLAGHNKNSALMRAVLAPGLLMQRITTKEPTDDMVEVAITSLNGVFEQEKIATETSSELT